MEVTWKDIRLFVGAIVFIVGGIWVIEKIWPSPEPTESIILREVRQLSEKVDKLANMKGNQETFFSQWNIDDVISMGLSGIEPDPGDDPDFEEETVLNILNALGKAEQTIGGLLVDDGMQLVIYTTHRTVYVDFCVNYEKQKIYLDGDWVSEELFTLLKPYLPEYKTIEVIPELRYSDTFDTTEMGPDPIKNN